MSTRIPIFLAGTLCGLYVSENFKISKKWVVLDYIVLITACIAVVYFHKYDIYPYLKPIIYYLLSISFILAIANKNIFSLSSHVEKGLIWIGNYSMEIYLVYETIWSLCRQYVKAFISSPWIYFGMVFVLALLCAIILKYLSRKIIDFINAGLSSWIGNVDILRNNISVVFSLLWGLRYWQALKKVLWWSDIRWVKREQFTRLEYKYGFYTRSYEKTVYLKGRMYIWN